MVSIHAPVQAGDFFLRHLCSDYVLFQSTPPYKRATTKPYKYQITAKVSIHAPVQAGDSIMTFFRCSFTVSIHAPVQAGDIFCSLDGNNNAVSIHAPVQAGDDLYR